MKNLIIFLIKIVVLLYFGVHPSADEELILQEFTVHYKVLAVLNIGYSQISTKNLENNAIQRK